MEYFLGSDLGGTKTHILIADESGQVVGFGEGGPGNHQSVGYDGMLVSLQAALDHALRTAGLPQDALGGAGFGIAGYDWPSDKRKMGEVIAELGLSMPYAIYNDAIPGLIAGSAEGWGVVVVSGTGCNCRGLDKDHKREGRVTGYGVMMGEAAGASELVYFALQRVAFEWTKRGPETALSRAFVQYAGARDLEDLLEGYTEGYHMIGAAAAPLIFQVAAMGDPVACELIEWAGSELGELALGVIRQLNFEELAFDVVLVGSMFEGGPRLIEPLRNTIQREAPGARLVRLTIPPVIGAVLLGMEQAGMQANAAIRQTLTESVSPFLVGTLK